MAMRELPAMHVMSSPIISIWSSLVASAHSRLSPYVSAALWYISSISSASSAVSAMSVCSVARPMDIRGLSMSLSACISSKTRLMTSSVSARLCLLKVQVMLR